MLTKRIIACLDVDAGRVVKGVQFSSLRDTGDPAQLAMAHGLAGADEVVLLDISATYEHRSTLLEVVRRTARQLFIPFTVGGGIRSLDDAAAVFDAGADKVTVNSAALSDPALITRIAHRYGSQAVIVAIDALRVSNGEGDSNKFSFGVKATGGRHSTGRDAVAWACEAERSGAGEIMLTSIDRDGTRGGFDCELTRVIVDAVNIPVIASGGAGIVDHFVDVFRDGRADAALAASIFHLGIIPIGTLKQELQTARVPMRWPC
jgi:cyclase